MKQILALLIVLFLVPLTASAQDFCEGNFDYDDDQDGSDAVQFKEDFGRMSYDNPCPPDGPAPVQKTGHTRCWNEDGDQIVCHPCVIGGGPCYPTGQDGMWQKGVAFPEPRFTDNGDGTVTDNLTGLIWLKNANCFGQRTWQEALDDCNGLFAGYCGLTDGSIEGDWRLPNRRELFSLVHEGYAFPAVSNTTGTGQHMEGDPFINFNSDYWTSSTFIGVRGRAIYVYLGSGMMYDELKIDQPNSSALGWRISYTAYTHYDQIRRILR